MVDNSRHAASVIHRLIPALLLKLELYRQVSTSRGATMQALLVVMLSGISNGMVLHGHLGSGGIAAGVEAAVLGWLLSSVLILLIARVLGHRRAGRSLLAPLGFATAPGVFLILGVIPFVGRILHTLVVLWMVAATVPAIQAVYETSRRRAIVIAVVGFLLYVLLGIVSEALLAGSRLPQNTAAVVRMPRPEAVNIVRYPAHSATAPSSGLASVFPRSNIAVNQLTARPRCTAATCSTVKTVRSGKI